MTDNQTPLFATTGDLYAMIGELYVRNQLLDREVRRLAAPRPPDSPSDKLPGEHTAGSDDADVPGVGDDQ